MNEIDLTRLVTLVAEVWPNYPVPDDREGLRARVQAWALVLGEASRPVTLAEAGEAIRRLARDGREFAPNPGQVYREVMDERAASAKALRRPDHQIDLSVEYDQSKMDELKAALGRVGR